MTPEQAGRELLGPIVAEHCLRLWSTASQIRQPEELALLFCARGGLRLQLAQDHFAEATGLVSPVVQAPLMISRIVALRSAVGHALTHDAASLGPAASTMIQQELSARPLSGLVSALAGSTSPDTPGPELATPDGLLRALRGAAHEGAARSLHEQDLLFRRHLAQQLQGRSRGVLVDTGFYGTTRELLAEADPSLDIGSILLGRSFRPSGVTSSRTSGLLVEAGSYVPTRPRTALLRYWHLVEWLFEPVLPSVSTFSSSDGATVRSNLETPQWQDAVEPAPGSAWAGVLSYLDDLPRSAGARVAEESAHAWRRLRRAVVWPDREDGLGLSVGRRTHGLGRDEEWGERPWRGPVGALRGSSMWREGEIARSGTRVRLPLLAAVETGYAVRYSWRRAREQVRARLSG